MSTVLLWVLVVFSTVLAVLLIRVSASQRRTQQAMDDFRGELARLSARTELLEHQLNQSWQIIEQRIGKIQQTFESGQACRVGTTLSQFDLKIGQLNRKIEDLMDYLPRLGRTNTEAS
jgi:type II secretory pathway pseudopilin PulG